MKKVAVIILNYNGAHFIKKLFTSLAEQTFNDFEIIFVDNASTDNSLDVLANTLKTIRDYPISVKVIVNKENTGFCRGNNVGLTHTTCEYIVFLNNDTFVDSRWLEELVRVLDAYNEVGACQSKLVSAHINNVQNIGHSFDAYGWPSPKCNLSNHDNVTNDILIDTMFYPSGASVIIRKEILLRCNGFDENLFYGDYDLGWRIRLLGYKIAVNLKSVCFHFGSHTVNSLFPHLKLTYQSFRERLYVLSKNYSLSRVMKRLPISITLMFCTCIYLSYKFRKAYLNSLLRAVVWNIERIKIIMMERTKVQSTRLASDVEIESHMTSLITTLSFNKS
ncbi:glycosyltransferase family 2 protein [Candidatus Bathyarchaeota archaeon]|nr:glycosyltransferase family 2 protein [Candidatus Bathyarchaeota archaeon]